jgi:undecaprenyl-phosphate 4-deoxy-4-formamido-L-arabinose transferase
MVISSGTKPLRLVSITGIITSVLGIVLAVAIVIERINNPALPLGWAAVMVALLFLGALILIALGVMAMGKPTSATTSIPQSRQN